MVYDENWRHPARHTEQARCKGRLCTPEGVPNALVMACTLDEEGLCAQCSDTARKQDDRRLRLDW